MAVTSRVDSAASSGCGAISSTRSSRPSSTPLGEQLSMKLENKVAIVTGAAQGIGLRYAEFLAREGAKVAIVDIKAEAAAEAAASIAATGAAAIPLVVDGSDPEATRNMARQTAD